MKQLITILSFLTIGSQVYSQCTIDSNPTSPGIYPSVLPNGCVGKPYDATATLVFPVDTVLFGFTIPLDSIQYVVSNVPAGLTSFCHNSNCKIICNPPNIPRGCVGFTGVPTVATSVGNTVNIDATIYVTVPFVGVQAINVPLVVELSIFNNPDVSVTATTTTLTSNEVAATYQWLDCNNGNAPIAGETSAIFTPSVSGNYAVEVTPVSGCVDTSACTAFTAIAGVNENNLTAYSISPNPIKDQFNITFAEFVENVSVAIYTANGTIISSKEYSNCSSIETAITGEAGIYLIALTINGQTSHTRVIKN
jgi:hypothetical protein